MSLLLFFSGVSSGVAALLLAALVVQRRSSQRQICQANQMLKERNDIGFQQMVYLERMAVATEGKLHASLRSLIVEIAKMWPGHEGVDWQGSTIQDLLLLIRDAVEGDREKLKTAGVSLLRGILGGANLDTLKAKAEAGELTAMDFALLADSLRVLQGDEGGVA